MNHKEDLQNLLKKLPDDRDYNFGLRDGYIFSSLNLQIRFELFIRENNIGLKYPIPNIDNQKIEAINCLIKSIESLEITHKLYGSDKKKYSIWEISLDGVKQSEIPNIIEKLDRIKL